MRSLLNSRISRSVPLALGFIFPSSTRTFTCRDYWRDSSDQRNGWPPVSASLEVGPRAAPRRWLLALTAGWAEDQKERRARAHKPKKSMKRMSRRSTFLPALPPGFSPKVVSRIRAGRAILGFMTDRLHVRLVRFCKFSLAIVLVLFLGIGVLLAQVLQHKKSTELLVKRYEKLVAEGSLLAPDGWARTSSLFKQSDAYPADGEIQLISSPGIIGETQRNGDGAKVETKWGDYYGTIDSHLRYKPVEYGGRIMLGESFSLVFVHRRRAEEVAMGDSGDWLIEGPLHMRSADIAHTIRYVERMHDQSNDPAIRRNADKTIAALKQLTASGCGSASAC